MASVFGEVDKSWAAVFDDGDLSFNDAVVISGIDARQLRNGLDRGVFAVGKKLRVGRWAFSPRDCFQLLVTNQLSSRTWMPIGRAAEIARRIAPLADNLAATVTDTAADVQANGSDAIRLMEFVIFEGEAGPVVLILQRGGEGSGYYSLDGADVDLKTANIAHIRLPVAGLMSMFMRNWVEALGDEMDDGLRAGLSVDDAADRATRQQAG